MPEYLFGGNNNDTLSTEYLFKGNLDEIDNTTFTPMLLSTIICPQYLRGVGVCGRLRVCPSSLPSPSSPTVTALSIAITYPRPLTRTVTRQRNSVTSSHHHTPLGVIESTNSTKCITYVLLTSLFVLQLAVYQRFSLAVCDPKRVTSPFASSFGGHLGQTLDTSWTLRHWTQTSKHPPFYPPFGRLDHERVLQRQIYALFRLVMPFFVTRPNRQNLTNPFVEASM